MKIRVAFRRHGARLLLPVLFVVSGCDFPTELPIFEPRLVVEAEKTTLSVSQLLPSSVTLAGNAFALSLSPASQSRTLGQMCPECPSGTGPKPPFTFTMTATTNLPADVRAAALNSGTVAVAINNQLGFDPVRPGGAETGTAIVTIRSGTTVIGVDTVRGSTRALPSGTTTTVNVPVRAGTVSGPITAEVVVTSPAGPTMTLNTSSSFTVTATPQNFLVSSATVSVTNKAVSVTQVTIDLDDIDESLRDRVKEGALVLDIANPFGVSGTLTATFSGPGVTVAPKPIPVQPGTTRQRIAFTGAELKSMLGKQVVMTISGPVSGPAAGVVVTPVQVLNISTLLDITLTTKAD